MVAVEVAQEAVVDNNESSILYANELVATRQRSLVFIMEIISFVVDCFGTWTVTLYVFINHI